MKNKRHELEKVKCIPEHSVCLPVWHIPRRTQNGTKLRDPRSTLRLHGHTVGVSVGCLVRCFIDLESL